MVINFSSWLPLEVWNNFLITVRLGDKTDRVVAYLFQVAIEASLRLLFMAMIRYLSTLNQ